MRGRFTGVGVLAAIAIALAAPGTAAAKTVSHTFDGTALGWEFFDGASTAAASWEALSGLPPGAISGVDGAADTEPGASFRSPAAFDGDYTPNIGGTIGFDLGVKESPAGGRSITLALIDEEPTFPVAIIHQFTPPSGVGFTHYTTPLSLDSWQYCAFGDDPPCPAATDVQFALVTAHVDRLVVIADIVSGSGEIYVLDNVSLSEPAPTPTPVVSPAIATTPLPVTTARRCGKGKRLVKRKGKRKCVRKRRK